MTKHYTRWEDEGMASISCPEKHVDDFILSSGEPDVCPGCGKTLTLIWNVSIKED
jgi:hypothetical protein